MKCEDAQNRFASYWDMSDNDEGKIELEAHLLDCDECSEQFDFWRESDELIAQLSEEPLLTGPADHVNRSVMDRIYSEQSWLMPVPSKSYQFSKSFRRNIAGLIAACMAMFVCAFFVFIFDYKESPAQEQFQELSGLLDTANASGEGMFLAAGFYAEVPVASISDPFVLKVVPSFPQYYVALSLLGLVMSLLIMNWLSRTRS